MRLRLALHMAKADLLQIVRDRKALLLMIVMPLLLTTILSFALGGLFGGGTFSPFQVSVYNADGGQVGAGVVQTLESVKPMIHVQTENSLQAARDDVTTGKSSVAVWVPAGHLPVSIEAPLNAQTQVEVVQSIIDTYGQRAGVSAHLAKQFGAVAQSSDTSAVQLHVNASGLHRVTAGSYYAIGMMVMFMLTNAANRAAEMVEERNGDRYARLVAAPTSRQALCFGYLLSNVLILALQGGLLLVCAHFILGIQLGSWDKVVLITLSYATALAGLAVWLGSTIRSVPVMSGISGIGSQILAVLGGSIYPLFAFPQVVRVVGQWLPNGLAVKVLVDGVIGESLQTMLTPIAYLLLFGIVFGTIASFRYGKIIRL